MPCIRPRIAVLKREVPITTEVAHSQKVRFEQEAENDQHLSKWKEV